MIDRKIRFEALRKELISENIDGFIIPLSDRFQNEYPHESSQRLEWLTGFSGSAGVCVVLKNKAVVITDSRYSIQVVKQVNSENCDVADVVDMPLSKWIKENCECDSIIGYDPWLHTSGEIDKIACAVADEGIAIQSVDDNLIDRIWKDRACEPASDVEIYPMEHAGLSHGKKIKAVSDVVKKSGCYACIITMADSIAWLLNIRGDDCPHVPVACSYAVVYAKTGIVDLFIDSKRISNDVKDYFGEKIRLFDMSELENRIEKLANVAKSEDQTILLDSARTPQWFRNKLLLCGVGMLDQKDPSVDMKAIKNDSEIGSMINAHVRDGVAIIKFLRWLDGNKGINVTEMDVDEKLIELRSQYQEFRGVSFDTIAGSGANGAIVHYRSDEQSNIELVQDSLLLVDSGAQYIDGTTDITRTMAVGKPNREMKERFTRVLKGHINLAMAHFPEGTTGTQIDFLARKPLWDVNLDYAHGTGHGVGCYLSVHEDAAGISPRSSNVIKENMIHSNEPGYYKEGEYGIRVESLILCKDSGAINSDGKKMLEFETITFAPMDKALIVIELLNDKEIKWLKDYHKKVFDKVSGFLNDDEKEWLLDYMDLDAA